MLITLLDIVEAMKSKHGLGAADNAREERRQVVEFVLITLLTEQVMDHQHSHSV